MAARPPEPQPEQPARVTITVPRWVGALLDPGVRAALVLLAVAAAGFAVLALGWRGAAAAPYVPLQMPWLLSGGFVGIALIGASLGALDIHLGRTQDARFRAEMDDALRDVAVLAERLRDRQHCRPSPRVGR